MENRKVKEETNRIVKRNRSCAANLSNRSIETPAGIAIRVTEVRNPPHHEKVTARRGKKGEIIE